MNKVQHTRPLWVGFIACALLPPIVFSVLLMFSSERVMIHVELVAIISLMGSLFGTLFIALPYVLWLRRNGKLNAIRLVIAGVLAGAATYAVFTFYNAYYPEMNDQIFMLKMALKTAMSATLPGAIIGFLSAAALCVGAGITIKSSRR